MDRFGFKEVVVREADPKHISTSYVECQNLNHVHHVALYFVHYNFCRMHKTLRVSPAMAAGVTDTLRDVEWIVGLIDARAKKPGARGPYKKRTKAS